MALIYRQRSRIEWASLLYIRRALGIHRPCLLFYISRPSLFIHLEPEPVAAGIGSVFTSPLVNFFTAGHNTGGTIWRVGEAEWHPSFYTSLVRFPFLLTKRRGHVFIPAPRRNFESGTVQSRCGECLEYRFRGKVRGGGARWSQR